MVMNTITMIICFTIMFCMNGSCDTCQPVILVVNRCIISYYFVLLYVQLTVYYNIVLYLSQRSGSSVDPNLRTDLPRLAVTSSFEHHPPCDVYFVWTSLLHLCVCDHHQLCGLDYSVCDCVFRDWFYFDYWSYVILWYIDNRDLFIIKSKYFVVILSFVY